MKSLHNSSRGRWPLGCLAILSVALPGIIVGCTNTHAGIFSARLIKTHDCTATRAVQSEWLKERSVSDKLIMIMPPASSDSVDAALMREKGLAGMIGERKVFREDAEIADGQTIIFTGAVYLREASGLEIWVGGSQDHIYCEVRLNQQLWMLDLTGFDAPPFDFCL